MTALSSGKGGFFIKAMVFRLKFNVALSFFWGLLRSKLHTYSTVLQWMKASSWITCHFSAIVAISSPFFTRCNVLFWMYICPQHFLYGGCFYIKKRQLWYHHSSHIVTFSFGCTFAPSISFMLFVFTSRIFLYYSLRRKKVVISPNSCSIHDLHCPQFCVNVEMAKQLRHGSQTCFFFHFLNCISTDRLAVMWAID